MLIQRKMPLKKPRPVSLGMELSSKSLPTRVELSSVWRESDPCVSRPVVLKGERREIVKDVDKALEMLYGLCQSKYPDQAVGLVLEMIDELIASRRYRECNALLDGAAVERLSVRAMLAMLMGTFRAKAVLASRSGLYRRVGDRLRAIMPDEAQNVLTSLE